MAEPPVDRDEFARWRDEADGALRAAPPSRCGPAQLGVLRRQAARLAVNGLLHGLGRGPWGHDLVRLSEQLGELGELPGPVLDALRRLSRHYIPARYPDAHPSGPPGMHYGASDSAEAIPDTSRVLGHIGEVWDSLSR